MSAKHTPTHYELLLAANAEMTRLREINRELVKALMTITPGQLEALAAYLDKTDAQIGMKGDDVQRDLRSMAAKSRAALSRAGGGG